MATADGGQRRRTLLFSDLDEGVLRGDRRWIQFKRALKRLRGFIQPPGFEQLFAGHNPVLRFLEPQHIGQP